MLDSSFSRLLCRGYDGFVFSKRLCQGKIDDPECQVPMVTMNGAGGQ